MTAAARAARQVAAAAAPDEDPRAPRRARVRPRAPRPGEQRPAQPGTPLLASKLAPPLTAPRLVARPRLLALLETGAHGPLTLVAAPAGAGKTTVLGAWTASRRLPGPVAWLSLDSDDNEPARFWSYVLAALRQSGAVPADSVLRCLAPRPGADEPFLPSLVNGLAELPTPVVLVLDDVHELTHAAVLEGLRFLLRHAPPQLRLVLASRADPPLPLQRMLLSGELTQVRAADLAFTVAEVAELLAEHQARPGLSDDDLALLQERTEGWAAGLRLVALSLQSERDPHRFVTELAGDNRSIADYLVGEVLDRLPGELRTFLLRTSVVDELNGDLANALTGRPDGEGTLARLERANAFVVALGSRRAWYRYHELFAGLLRYELRRVAPDEVAGLHRRAARWYGAQGLTLRAVEQELTAGDWRRAADLMAERGLGLVLRGEAATLRQLVGRLPAELVQTDPELALLAAADRIASDDLDGASAYLQLATQRAELLDHGRRDRFARTLATCELGLARLAGDLDEVLAAGPRALALTANGDADDDARAVTLAALGWAELWTGDPVGAEAHLREGQAVAVQAGLGLLELDCTSQLAVLHALRGALGQARRTGRKSLELAEEHAWSSFAQAAGGHLALAWVHYQWNDLAEASRYLEQAAASLPVPKRPLTLGIAIVRARLQHARGDLAGALATVRSARRELSESRPPGSLWRWLVVAEAELRAAAGETQQARALLEQLDEGGPLPAGEAVARARAQLAEGDPDGATETLAPCLASTGPPGSLSVLVEAYLLDALASDALTDHDRAAASLQRALALAEQEGLRRSFLDGGAPARSLLARYRDRIPTFVACIDELLRASVEPVSAAGAPLPELIEALTDRERVVLRYLPSMMTYEEIASDLYVSLNTVKSHVQSIYRKLGVSGRRAAVLGAHGFHLP